MELIEALNEFYQLMKNRFQQKEEEGYKGWDDISIYAKVVNDLSKDLILLDKASRFAQLKKITPELEKGKERLKLLAIDIANRAMIVHYQINKQWAILEEEEAKCEKEK